MKGCLELSWVLSSEDLRNYYELWAVPIMIMQSTVIIPRQIPLYSTVDTYYYQIIQRNGSSECEIWLWHIQYENPGEHLWGIIQKYHWVNNLKSSASAQRGDNDRMKKRSILCLGWFINWGKAVLTVKSILLSICCGIIYFVSPKLVWTLILTMLLFTVNFEFSSL